MMDDILTRVLDILKEVIQEESSSLNSDTELKDVINSLSAIAVIVKIESIFNIEISDEELDFHNFHTPADLAEYVAKEKMKAVESCD